MANTRVYFGRLARDVRERDIDKLAGEFGRIRDIRLLNGFAFVEFDDERDARDAVKELDGTRFLGERIIVEIAKPRSSSDDRRRFDRDDRRDRRDRPRATPRMENRIVVQGLPSRSTWQDLKDLFRKAGEVKYTNVEPSGDGIVEFVDLADKDRALIDFQDYEYNGSRLTVKDLEGGSKRDDRREDRDRSRDRRDERSRSRSPRRRRSESPRSPRD